MLKEKNNTANEVEYKLKYYQIKKEIEKVKKESKKDSEGSYNDLLKYRRGRSKH